MLNAVIAVYRLPVSHTWAANCMPLAV